MKLSIPFLKVQTSFGANWDNAGISDFNTKILFLKMFFKKGAHVHKNHYIQFLFFAVDLFKWTCRNNSIQQRTIEQKPFCNIGPNPALLHYCRFKENLLTSVAFLWIYPSLTDSRICPTGFSTQLGRHKAGVTNHSTLF